MNQKNRRMVIRVEQGENNVKNRTLCQINLQRVRRPIQKPSPRALIRQSPPLPTAQFSTLSPTRPPKSLQYLQPPFVYRGGWMGR